MRKHMLKAISALCMSALVFTAFTPAAHAEEAEATPKVIFSTIEGESVEIEIADAIKSNVARVWYCNDEVVTLDETHIDTSEGTTARLMITEAKTSDHMDKYRCVSPGKEETDTAQLYVISKDNYENADLLMKDFDAVTGSALYAKQLTLYIDKTPYPNFAPLQFVEDGELVDKVRVKNGEHTYTLADKVYGREVTVTINGVGDKVAPTIKYLGIKDGIDDRFASEKTVVVEATDDVGLPEDAYYFEKDEMLASAVKVFVLDGATADDLNGVTWTKDKQFKVTSNGTYTVFVRDLSGNITYKDITVKKISTTAPVISDIALVKEDGKACLKVTAKDVDKQPIFYRLNGEAWQDNGLLYGVKEGENKIEVKNEAGNTSNATKTVYLSLFLGTEEGFTEEALYNYITVSPNSWTNKSVTVSLVLPDALAAKLSAAPYSINGATFTTSRTRSVSNNGETVQFQVKDLYGNTHTAKTFTVSNIDKEKPSIEVTSNEGTFTVKALDSGSGIQKITVSSTSAKDYVIKANSSDGVKEDSATYKAPSNGTYQFTVTDYAGNTVSVSGSMKFYTENRSSGNSTVRSSNTKAVTSSASSSSSKNTGASVLGAKKETTEKSSSSSTKESAKSSTAKTVKKDNKVKKEDKQVVKTDEKSARQTVKIDRSTISKAGNSVSPVLDEVEKIDVVREQDTTLASAPLMLETKVIDNSKGEFLKKLVLFVLGLSAVAIGIVIWVNSGKKLNKDDYSFRK